MKLYMEPARLKECADLFRREAQTQLNKYAEVKTIVARLESGWKGAAEAAFQSRYIEQEARLKALTAQRQQFADLIQATADEMDTMDSGLTRFFSQY